MTECTSLEDCPRFSTDCNEGICVCSVGLGNNCSEFFNRLPNYKEATIAYTVIAILFQVLVLSLASYELLLRVIPAIRKNQLKWNVALQCLVCIIIGSIERIVHFCIDPHGLKGILSLAVNLVVYNFSIVIWLYAAYFLFLYWAEIIHSTRIELQSVQKLKPYLIGLMIITAVLAISISIWTGVAYSALNGALYQIVIALFLVILIILNSVYGYKLLRIIAKKNTFLKKITWCLFAFDFFALMAIAALITYLVMPVDPWQFLAINSVVRCAELGLILSVLALFFTKRQKKESNSNHVSVAIATMKSEDETKNQTNEQI